MRATRCRWKSPPSSSSCSATTSRSWPRRPQLLRLRLLQPIRAQVRPLRPQRRPRVSKGNPRRHPTPATHRSSNRRAPLPTRNNTVMKEPRRPAPTERPPSGGSIGIFHRILQAENSLRGLDAFAYETLGLCSFMHLGCIRSGCRARSSRPLRHSPPVFHYCRWNGLRFSARFCR